jgi:GT2 family glycosyltransferase
MIQKVTFIVPTLRRPQHLRRCLKAIGDQTLAAQEILVGIKPEDEESCGVVSEFSSKLPVQEVRAEGVGVVGSMSSCLASSKGAFIALLDDDVEVPLMWTEVMMSHLKNHPECVAAGGRDILLDHPEMRRKEPLVEDVGRFRWYGRITGNHHRAGGAARCVDVLRGSNMLLRGEFLREVGFETDLLGSGAQVNWELALALYARARGNRMFFDPHVHVIHHVAPRHDDDLIHRGVFSTQATSEMAFNETLAIAKHGRGLNRVMLLFWLFAVGSHNCPGLIRLAELATPRRASLMRRFAMTWSGRWAALRA